MTQEDPKDRITMEEAVNQLDDIIKGLSTATLRSRAVRMPGGDVPAPNIPQKAIQSLAYWARRFSYVARSIPPIPVPPVKRTPAAAAMDSVEPTDPTE